MTLIDKIKADREAGTAGDWHVGKDHDAGINRGFFVAGCGRILLNIVGDKSSNDTDARRIARVPDMEAALLAVAAIIRAGDALADDSEQGRYSSVDIQAWDDALAAYRKAIGEA